jgi:cytidylate kinase
MTPVSPYKQALLLIGPRASGKSTLARLMAVRLGRPCLSFGGYVRDYAAARGIPSEPAVLEELGARLIVERGYAGLLDDVLMALPESTGVVLDGVRHPEMLGAVAARFADVLSCYIDAPDNVRYERWLKREHVAVSAASLRRFQQLADGPVERHVSELGTLADLVLDGSQPAEALIEIVERLIVSRHEQQRTWE